MLVAGVALIGAAVRAGRPVDDAQQSSLRAIMTPPARASVDAAALRSAAPVLTISASADSGELEAIALNNGAEGFQYEKEFSAALGLYQEIVSRFPDSRIATHARTQITNLS